MNKSEFETRLIPTLTVHNGWAALEFYQAAFGAEVLMCVAAPDNTLVAELAVGEARFLVADEAPEQGNPGPLRLGGTPVRLSLLVPNPDEVARQALQAGATEIYPVADQDYGMRLGRIVDPFGHHWEIYRPL